MRWSTLSLLAMVASAALLGYFAGRHATHSIVQNSSNEAATLKRSSVADTLITDTTSDASSSPWQNRWTSAISLKSAPARDRELAALITELARTDPQRALKLASEESNWRLRDILRNAALKGWASVAPTAAADWALALRFEERRSAVEAVMQGAAANPTEAVKTALHICNADSAAAGDYGHYTIAALTDAGAFREAVQFSQQVGTDKYPFLMKSAFFQWSRNQPQEAMAAVDSIQDPVLKAQAYGEAISGWAWTDGKAVAEYALSLSSGSSRNEVLAEALPRWVEKDPIAATEWINNHDSGPEFDSGIEAVANLQSLIQSRPSNALELAGNISDPSRRAHAMRAIFRQWASNDPAAAQQYAENSPSPTDRAFLSDELKDMLPN
ncbi:MAG: hypothetical protein QM790_18990 [Nibricoccus sp.]